MGGRMKCCILLLAIISLAALASCAEREPLKVIGQFQDTPVLRRCLLYWTAQFSTHPSNHFHVGKTNYQDGFVQAFIYWKEERTLLEWHEVELDPESSDGLALAFHHDLKLDRDTVDTAEDIGGSTYLETHRTWIDWMEACISLGKEYTIDLGEAKKAFPE
jgi:hypothetical protein